MRTSIASFVILLSTINQLSANCTEISATRLSASYVTVDANDPCGNQSPVPQAAYIGYLVCNEGGHDLFDISATFTPDAAATSTRFIFGLTGGQAATQSQPFLGPLECQAFYWFVSYTSNDCSQNGNWHDGQSLAFDINVTATDATGNACPATLFDGLSVETRSSVTAQAGATVVSGSLDGGDVLGGVTEVCINYEFGNITAGTEVNLQPAGNFDFNAGCFGLVGSRIAYSEIGGIPSETQDRLSFINDGTTTDGNDANTNTGDVTVCYYFQTRCTNTSSTFRPYADAQSGGQHKYTANLDFTLPPNASTSQASIHKTVSKSEGVTNNEVLVYTVDICNPSATVDISLDKVVDELPAGFTYLGMDEGSSDIFLHAAVKPAAGETNALTWEDGSESGVFPLREILVRADKCLKLVYFVEAPMNIEDDATVHTNIASYHIGGTIVSATADVVSNANPLPVELASFEGYWDGSQMVLEWATATEDNTFYFEVQRMGGDDKEFVPIGEVAAKGNSAELTDYAFIDRTAGEENYYRLKIVDFDGYTEFSPTIHLTRSAAQSLNASSFPNPSNGTFNISIDHPSKEELIIIVIDMDGRQVAEEVVSSGESKAVIPMDLQHLPAGAYVYTVSGTTEMASGKFIIKRH